MEKPANRIVVVGVSASGKSIFSRKLSAKTGLSLTMMDEIMWEPGWNYIGDEKTVDELKKISENDKWIIEGYITTKARTFLFEKADEIIYLDYSPWVSSMRYLKRWWKHRINPRPEMKGSPEKFSFKFLKLVWTKGESVTLEKFLKDFQDKLLVLKSPKEATKYLSSF